MLQLQMAEVHQWERRPASNKYSEEPDNKSKTRVTRSDLMIYGCVTSAPVLG